MAGKKGDFTVVVVTDGGRNATGGSGGPQCFPPGIDEVCEFAMVRLDEAAASRRAWLGRQEARSRELSILQRLFGEEIGRTKREARMSVLFVVLMIGLTILLIWGVSGNNSDQSKQDPCCK